jgi:hypothetical protein
MDGEAGMESHASPNLGEHTREVLQALSDGGDPWPWTTDIA